METPMQKLAAQIIADVKAGKLVVDGLADVKEAVKGASGFLDKIIAGAQAIGKLVYSAVKYVETIAADLQLVGRQKKELAVEIINQLIDLPLLPEKSEALIIGFAIDVLVTGFNLHIGHKWLGVKPQP